MGIVLIRRAPRGRARSQTASASHELNGVGRHALQAPTKVRQPRQSSSAHKAAMFSIRSTERTAGRHVLIWLKWNGARDDWAADTSATHINELQMASRT